MQHITNNLPKLIELTEFNCMVNAEFLAEKILCKADFDVLVSINFYFNNSTTVLQQYCQSYAGNF